MLSCAWRIYQNYHIIFNVLAHIHHNISYSILKKVFDRGVAAWRTGHRPGTTPEQWGYARINSFATGGKTRTTADADLWKKHKGMKESDFKSHWMYDPKTGEKVHVPEKYVPHFKPGANLRKRVNRGNTA